MRRFIIALRLKGLEATQQLHEGYVGEARRLLSHIACSVVDVRIGGRRLEVDVLTDNPDEVVKTLSTGLAPLEYVREVAPLEGLSEEEIVNLAVSLFNDERFWEAHEALEQVWRNKAGEEREVLSGLIKLSAAFVHAQKGRGENSLRMLQSALNHLSRWSRERYYNVNVEALRKELELLSMSGLLRIIRIPV
ncbi:MAG: DUF309 domain-containing protein [Nitrososphaerota archaeon]